MLPQTGLLPATSGTIYTVPSKLIARLEWLQVVTSVATIFQLHLTVRGTQVALTALLSVEAGLWNVLEGVPLRLGEGDSIQGVATTATDASFLIAGEEMRHAG